MILIFREICRNSWTFLNWILKWPKPLNENTTVLAYKIHIPNGDHAKNKIVCETYFEFGSYAQRRVRIKLRNLFTSVGD
jgi:hypothetical protein